MTEAMRVETVGNATLYLGDCREVAPSLENIDAVITDPPYGMDWDANSKRYSGGQSPLIRRKRGEGRNWPRLIGDDEPFDPTPWLEYPKVVLWGWNHFAALLPIGTALVWVKKDDHLFGTFLSDCEIGWMKGGHGVYAYRENFAPPSRKAENFGATAHPTQKPTGLMTWAVQKAKATGTVLDPYMGSGTTGVACAALGLPFIGIEIEPRYFETAIDRIGVAHANGRLFA